MIDERLDALAQVMAEHMARPFPPGFRGLGIVGWDMVMLDADAYAYAACVHEGLLPERTRVRLPRRTSAFVKVLPAITDEYAATYASAQQGRGVRRDRERAQEVVPDRSAVREMADGA
ncbi:hypothetical protein [Streptomyces sp. SAS_260]|uniref:hypothetical protein n=1 Tax=Streptomyces sp. SAS_260 TaxID=3412751 RepID=UPI00403C6DFC